MLFGAPRLIHNLTLAKKRKISIGYIEVKPEIIELKQVLQELKINQEQLIIFGVLIGTDYNPKGFKGIGPKKAIELIHKYKKPTNIFSEAEKIAKGPIDFNPYEIISVFKEMPLKKEYKIEFTEVNASKIKSILCDEHDFNEERVNNALKKLEEAKEKQKQKNIDRFF